MTVLGEAGGLPVAGFDFDNSPSQIARVDLRGHTVVQRTTSGVQGLLRCRNADTLLAGSFVVAGATLRCLRSLQPERLALVITGDRPGYRAVEDHALAEYLQAALQAPAGHPSDPQPYLQQVRRWQPTPGTGQDRDNDRLQRDLDLCSQINTFDFALPVWHSHGRLVMHANPLPQTRNRPGRPDQTWTACACAPMDCCC